jgi:hypothetical protein
MNTPPELFTVNKYPDDAFYQSPYPITGELGQHMEWAEREMKGEVQGKDYFSLYGLLTETPYLISLALWKDKIKGFFTATYLLSAFDKVLFYFPALFLIKNPVVAAISVLLLRDTDTLAFFPITPYRLLFSFAFLVAGIRRKWWLSGFLFGISLYFSHECALVALVSLLLHHGFKKTDWKTLTKGALTVLLPCNLYLVLKHSFLAYYRNVYEYLRAISCGYAYIPYPPLSKLFPLRSLQHLWMFLTSVSTDSKLPLGYSYYTVPFLYALGLFNLFGERGWRRTLFTLFLYSSMLYTVVLSRTDTFHRQYATFVLPIILLLFLYKTVKDKMLLVLLLLSFFPMRAVESRCQYNLQQSLIYQTEKKEPMRPKIFAETVKTLKEMDEDYIFVFCNSPAVYFFTDKKNPTRFGQISQAVFRRHRREVYEDLVRKEVKVVFRDYTTSNFDGISDCEAFPEVCEYLKERFKEYVVTPTLSVFLRDDASPKDRALMKDLGYFGPIPPFSMPESPVMKVKYLIEKGGAAYVNRCGCRRTGEKNDGKSEKNGKVRISSANGSHQP